MSYEQILFEVDDPVAIITLNRPEALNAWTQTMANEVRDAVGTAEHDPTVVGIVLTGAGKGFCAGADMKGLAAAVRRRRRRAARRAECAAPFAEEAPTPGDASWGDDLRGTYTYLHVGAQADRRRHQRRRRRHGRADRARPATCGS